MSILKLAINTKAGWLGIPVGGYITSAVPPPKDDPSFRYILCTAGQDGAGQYNEGILTGETVTGSAPLVNAIATVSLAGSPFNGQTIHLINTEGRFVGAGEAEAFEDDALQNITGSFSDGIDWVNASSMPTPIGAFTRSTGSSSSSRNGTSNGAFQRIGLDASLVARTSDHTQPRAHRLPHYMRIL